MSYTYFMNDSQVTLINLSNGNRVTMFRDDARFTRFRELIQQGNYELAEKQDTKMIVMHFASYGASGFNLTIENGIGKVTIGGGTYELNNAITEKILKMDSEGFSPEPLVRFLENLYQNPSKTAVDELFLFLENTQLPITEDGCFIAYKIVRNDYKDIYSGTFDNSVGKAVELPRFEVDDNRNRTCSKGLHFCSKEYLPSYGSTNKSTDRCMLVKINPKDVVSIPSDYNNAKGRTCRYEVVGEVTADDWRAKLYRADYNSKSVVSSSGSDLNTIQDVFDANFVVDAGVFHWADSNRVTTREMVVKRISNWSSASLEDIDAFLNSVVRDSLS